MLARFAGVLLLLLLAPGAAAAPYDPVLMCSVQARSISCDDRELVDCATLDACRLVVEAVGVAGPTLVETGACQPAPRGWTCIVRDSSVSDLAIVIDHDAHDDRLVVGLAQAPGEA